MARGGDTRPPGSVADCVGSQEIARPPHGESRKLFQRPPYSGFAPLTRISLDLSALCENGAFLARLGEIRNPPDPWAIAWDLQEIARFPGDCQKLPHAPRATGLRHLLGFLGVCRNYAKTGPTWHGGTQYATRRIRDRLRRVFKRSRDFSANLRNFHMAPRGGFAPFTWISLDLSELCENGAYLARGAKYATPDPWPIA